MTADPAPPASPPIFPLADRGAGPAPLRRPGSVRRTTTLDSHWPQGLGRDSRMIGRGRDIVTPHEGGAPIELARSGVALTVSPMRQIVAIESDPSHPGMAALVGVRAGGASREALADAMGDARGELLFQMIDDFAGASLVAGWIWSQWDPGAIDRMIALRAEAGGRGPAINVCAGFAEGSSALDALARPAVNDAHRTSVPPLRNPADPEGWHDTPPPASEGPTSTRARRIDLWRDGASIRVDAGFQDSADGPDGSRVAIHEYRVHMTIDAETMVVRALQALPLILPFAECPAASINASRMVGQPIGEYRRLVLEQLPGTEGCTHLNDVLRALADVPVLARHLP